MNYQLFNDDIGVNQERVWQLLQELRQRENNELVREDIRILKRVLHNLIFEQSNYKNLSDSLPRQANRTSPTCQIASSSLKLHKVKISVDNALKSSPKFHNLLKYLETTLLPHVKSTEKLVFVEQQSQEIRDLVVKPNESGKRLIIIGPEDIKTKSAGRIRIGDQILAINQHLLHSLSSTEKSYTQSSLSNAFTRNDSETIGNRRLKQRKRERRSTTASDLVLAQRDYDICEVPSQITIWKSDIKKVAAVSWSSLPSSSSSLSSSAFPTLADRYENLTENIGDEGTCKESENSASIIVTLLRQSPHMVLRSDWTQVEIIHLPNIPGVGLGFSIVGSTSSGVIVKTILPGSVAAKDKRLCPGDHILKIRGISVHGMNPQQIAMLLRRQDVMVELVVGRPALYSDRSKDSESCWMMPTRDVLCRESFDEEIRKHTVLMPSGSSLLDVEGCENLNNNKINENNSDDDRATTINKSISISAKDPGPSQTVSAVIELTDSGQMPNDGTESKNSEDESIPKVPSKTIASETRSTRSVRELQEMALTIFVRENWIPHKYETIEVELCRDPVLGLGITIAGYVHKKEEINGVFVKSLVPNSSAFHSRKIQLNDLILEVNDKSLEGLNHSESIRTLLGSGTRVKIKLIRFLPDSPQAECLTMLQKQEAAAANQMMDVQNMLRDVVADWKHRLGSDFEVISVDLIPDNCDDGGLGISLEGTVDILNGTQLCPHHYIDSLRPGGPAAFSNALRSGDELLQANDVVLYGESHVTVRQALSKAASTSQRVRLTVARKVQTVNVFMPRPEEGLPIAYPLLASTDDRLVKAKSDTCITKFLDSTIAVLEQVSRRLRSRSLQLFNGLAIWRCVPTIVQLMKDSRGLGFSIVDYQDPLHPEQSVIVVRSLVPGGLAQADGRIIPGDRLLFVNDEDLSNSTLEHAVAVLKSTPDGLVRLGIAKPIPIEECGNGLNSHSPLISRSERVLAKGSSPRSRRRHRKQITSYTSSQETIWLGAFEYRRQQLQSNYQSSGSLTPSTPRTCNISLNGSYLSMSSWSPCSTRSLSPCGSPLRLRGSWAHDIIYLPPSLERSIKIQKGPLSLGIVLNSEIDKGINGCQVKSICSKKAIGLDGRVQVNDYIVKVNMESLRNVTNSQARAILKRTNLIGTQCNITYITASDAKIWKEKYHHEMDYQLPVVNRLSPRIFPKYYHSSCFDKKQMTGVEELQDFCDSNLLGSKVSKSSVISLLTKKQLNCAIIDGKIIDEFVHNFIQTLLKDVWQELLASEFLSKGTKFDLSEKERQPSLSALIDTTPSTSVFLQENKIQPALLTRKIDSSRNLRRKVKNMMDKLKTSNSEETQKLSQSGIRIPSEQLNLEQIIPEAEQVVIQDEKMRNSMTDTILINQSMSKNFPDSSPSSLSSELSMPPKTNRFWDQTRTVILDREPNQSFGISIVGGRVEVSNKSGQSGAKSTVSGIFIKSVLPNSPAGLSNMMHMGDRVISVNDQDLREATHEEAVQVIKNAKNPVKFVVQSLHNFSQYESDISEEKDENREENEKNMNKLRKGTECDNSSLTNKINAPEVSTKSDITSTLSEESDIHLRELTAIETDTRKESSASVIPKIELQKKIKFKFEETEAPKTAEIIKKSLINANEKKLEEVQTLEKSSRKQSKEKGESKSMYDARRRAIDPCSAAALPKRDDDPEEEDLFFYTKDKINRKYGNLMGEKILLKLDKVPHSGLGLSLASNRERDRTIILVVAVKSTCPLSVKIGDELLEVNGKVLTGLSHLNASSIMRQCCEYGILELLLLRRFEALAIVLESNGSNTVGNESQMSNNSETNVQHPVEDVKENSSRQNESVAGIEPGCETLIEIDKVGKGLGLSIVGGSDTVLGTVVIHEVYPDGAAAIDGRLKPGDQVLEVNGISLRGVSHEQAISLLRRTPAKVSLLIYRDVNLQLSLLDPTQIYNIFEMELTKKPGRGLGLSIVGRKNEPGVYVSEVVKGGSADADGRLIQGDQILAVNGQDVTNAMQEDVATKLKACTGRVILKVGRWKLTEAANKKHTTTEGALSNREQQHSGGTTEKLKMIKTPEIKIFAPNSDNDSIPIIPDDQPLPISMSISKSPLSKNEENQLSQVAQVDLSPVMEESSIEADQKSSVADEENSSAANSDQNNEKIELIRELKEENSDSLLVLLNKIPDQQLGMGIGKRSRGILVTSLQPGSIAAEKLKVGDRLMAVNGVAITDQLSAVALVKASGTKLWLQVSRPRTSENS